MSITNHVFVLDSEKNPLLPCKPSVARRLLSNGKAAVFRRFPFTIILKKKVGKTEPMLTIKIDPGSKFTGLALLNGEEVIWLAEIEHRGSLISKSLTQRSAKRRNRRNRKTRYRQPGLANNKKPEGWLAPSLLHRVQVTITWINRLMKFAPIKEINMELVKFDLPKMNDPEISGIEYQQGTLHGYELRNYLLEKFNRQCSYCGIKNVPLQIEHILAKSQGGSNRVSNLCLACEKCNQIKDNKPIEEFLKGKSEILSKIIKQALRPLKDATAVNSTRWKLFSSLKQTGLIVSTSSGGQTKFNRCRLNLTKSHCVDAACVSNVDNLVFRTKQFLAITCKGHGGRQKAALNKYGYPIRYNPLKPIKEWCSGDLALNVESRKVGRVNPRSASNSFNFTVPNEKAISVHVKKLKRVHRKDGYTYLFSPILSINV